jgi:F-type H+-transporting ATPase subunit delta
VRSSSPIRRPRGWRTRWLTIVVVCSLARPARRRCTRPAFASGSLSFVPIANELFAFDAAVRSDSSLELAIGTKLSDPEAKAGLVQRLLAGRASEQTTTIVSHLVRQPRGRRIGELLRTAAEIVSDQSDQLVATVTTARVLDDVHAARLEQGLSRQFGRSLRINQVVDPAVIGGLRVQVGDEVIDGTVATKLSALRLQLAG